MQSLGHDIKLCTVGTRSLSLPRRIGNQSYGITEFSSDNQSASLPCIVATRQTDLQFCLAASGRWRATRRMSHPKPTKTSSTLFRDTCARWAAFPDKTTEAFLSGTARFLPPADTYCKEQLAPKLLYVFRVSLEGRWTCSLWRHQTSL